MTTLPALPAVPQRRLVDAFATVGAATVQLLRRAPNPVQPVRRSRWTVSEVGAHLVDGLAFYIDLLRGASRPYSSWSVAEMAEHSRAGIDAVLSRGGDLAERLERHLEQWNELISADDLPATVAYHGGTRLEPLRVAAIMLGEHIVHGYDLAATLRRPWPIDPEHVNLVVRGVAAIMAPYVVAERARGLTAVYQLWLRGQSSYAFRFDNGELTVGGGCTGPGASVDCHISADPATYLLVAYGRLGPIRPTLTGKLVVHGRKPWLGPRFGRLLAAP